MTFTLKSSAFDHGQSIPIKYTCHGKNISPPLQWTEPPEKTQSLVLIADDPDAPYGWIHWVYYNIDPLKRSIDEACPKTYEFSDGSSQGMTDYRDIGYSGPCPSSGTHRYFFTLYALDTVIKGHLNMTKEDLMSQISGHIIATAQHMGIYSAK